LPTPTETPKEVTVSTTELSTAAATQGLETATVNFKLEVAIVPVSNADHSKQFYASLGWREDADFVFTDDFRVLQFTPPGSQASIIFGTGVTSAVPGTGGNLLLAVDDIDAARGNLIERGVDVSDVFHGVAFSADGSGREAGQDPERKSYFSYATFSDPDGNEWLLQEVTTRLPGRVEQTSVATLAELLLETAKQHDRFEKVAPVHDWWDWYAPYLAAREQGSNSELAEAKANRYMEEAHDVVVSR
jgi:catechol 2,3-dioxygenase-like lactoylglutathione lyase family enzyme